MTPGHRPSHALSGLRLITDASLRGGGRYAVVLESGTETVHQEVGTLPGRRADNSMFAEARALGVGLRRAQALGWQDFVAVTDNKNVVHMVRHGKTRFWHGLHSLVKRLGALLVWRRRHHVEAADRLLREYDRLTEVAAAVFGAPHRRRAKPMPPARRPGGRPGKGAPVGI